MTENTQFESDFIRSAKEFESRLEALRDEYPSFFSACFPDFKKLALKRKEPLSRNARGGQILKIAKAIEEHGPKTIRELVALTGVNRANVSNCMYTNNRGMFEVVPGSYPKTWRLVETSNDEPCDAACETAAT